MHFIPIDYDYFDFEGKNYAKIIGRNNQGKRVCIIDSCPVYFWAILKDNLKSSKIKKLIEKIENIKLDLKGRQTRVEWVELHNKHFLDKKVKALKIFATNYKDLHDIADKLDMNEIKCRRGYDLGFITHYIIEKKIAPLCWYEIEGEVLNNSLEFGGIDSGLDVDICMLLKECKSMKKNDFKPKTLAYDIETDEFKIGSGEILMVSLVGENFKKVITWKKTVKKPSYVEYVKDEEELLEKFVEHVREISPDFLVGYFSDGFDLPYLRARAEKLKVPLSLGLDETQPKFFRGAIMTGKINGIVHIDLLKFIQTAYAQYMQSETLSLNEVAKEFLGDSKKDFGHKHSSEIKEHDWKDYFEYNLHDSVLTYQLFEKFWPDLIEFSRVTQRPVFDISRAGLSKYVESYILHHLEKFNEIPEKRPTYDEIGVRRKRGPVEGAFVLEPTPGIYEDIAFFDFTSMHTSIIISMNISGSTLLEKPEKNSNTIETSVGKFSFTKKPGFIPLILKDIFEKRKKAKAEYKKVPDKITLARSNAFKLLSASVHGYLAFFGARYYSKESSASILAYVRKFNKDTIKNIEEKGYKVLYGDSINGKTKVIIKKDDKIYEENIENLFKKIDKKSVLGKEYNFKKGIEVLTLDEKGKSVFKPLIYTMRHQCNKKMYRVHFTNDWYIDVTEDHSLIGYQSSHFNQKNECKKDPLKRIIEIRPVEIKKKANSIISMKNIPQNNSKSRNYPKKVYEFIGFFIGDGSFCRNKAHNKYNKDYYLGLSLGKDKEEIIKNLINPLIKSGYIKNYWESKSRRGDIKINGLKLISIITKNCRSRDRKKTIPKWMFYEKEENIASFLRGLFTADGTVMLRNNAPIIKYTSINSDYIKDVRKLLYRIGISHSIFMDNALNTYKTKSKIYGGKTFSKNILIKDKETFIRKVGFILERKNKRGKIKTKEKQKKLIKNFEFDLQGVKKIEKIKAPKYVYDLEVEDTHRFFANYCLVHNTDSIAFLIGKKKKSDIKELLRELNSKLPGIMELELEDFFKRGLWVTTRAGTMGAKKKYALLGEDGKLKIRGFETVRRDWCDLARKVQSRVIDSILKDGNSEKALKYVKEIIKKLKNREIEKESLIIRTQLRKPLSEYKAITPHVIAARKMKERKLPVDDGGMVSYFIAETREKKKLVREKVKLPDEKGEYNIKYYLERQLLSAVENIFNIFNIEIKEVISGKKQMKLGDF